MFSYRESFCNLLEFNPYFLNLSGTRGVFAYSIISYIRRNVNTLIFESVFSSINTNQALTFTLINTVLTSIERHIFEHILSLQIDLTAERELLEYQAHRSKKKIEKATRNTSHMFTKSNIKTNKPVNGGACFQRNMFHCSPLYLSLFPCVSHAIDHVSLAFGVVHCT